MAQMHSEKPEAGDTAPEASTGASAGSPKDRLDGRRARSLRTRTAVTDALLELIQEGDLRPTAPDIADRAGVSLRSVFQHFSDLDTLFAEAAGRHLENARPYLGEPISAQGLLAERAAAIAAQRARLWEYMTPVRRAARLVEADSETLAAILSFGHESHRADVQRVFEPEIGDDAALLDACDLALSWDAWETLRRRQHLGVDDAVDVVRLTIECLLV